MRSLVDTPSIAAPQPTRSPLALRRAKVPGWWTDASGVAIWISHLVVVAMWVAGGGIQALTSPAGGFTSLGRLTGLVSANLLLIQVLLMARIPVLERSIGQDRLARQHRLVGFWSFALMLAHLAMITVGYALTSNSNPLVQVWQFVVDYPGMLLATAGTLLLVMVAMTSLRRARARLRYESWHLLHLYAYLGVGLAIPHMLWTGQEFLTSPLATAYWWSLWASAAGAIVVWRIGVPLYRSWRHHLEVERVVEEGPGVRSVIMRGRDLDRLGALAGQFFTWRFLNGPGWTRAHPYSLSAAPDQTHLRITVKDLGDGSHALADLRPGTRVLIEGPYGRLHAGVRTRQKVTLLASGIGISPIRALLEELPQRPGDVTVIYRAGSEADLVLRSELESLADRLGARLFFVVGHRLRERRSWLPESAAGITDPAALRQLVPDIAEQDVYLCGSGEWMTAAGKAARDCGVPSERLHAERFNW